MTEAKPTPGPWQVGPVDDTCVMTHDHDPIALMQGDYNNPEVWPVMEANAHLIAEAGTVHHETGLTPRQLAEHLAELLEVLEGVADQMQNLRGDGASMRVKLLSLHAIARAAIARARGEG